MWLCICVCERVLTLGIFCSAGETGAAHLLVSVRHLPVQQRAGERGPQRLQAHLLRLVTAPHRQQELPELSLHTQPWYGTVDHMHFTSCIYSTSHCIVVTNDDEGFLFRSILLYNLYVLTSTPLLFMRAYALELQSSIVMAGEFYLRRKVDIL